MKSWRWGDTKATDPESDAEDTRADRVRFFANIVNELRTPLTVILGQLDAALLEQDSDTRGHQIRVASRNARRLERLTNQAIELTRLDAGSLELRRRYIDLVQFVEPLVMSFEDLADRNALLLEFFSRRRSFRGEVDPHILTTIISNLMSNAIKYTPGGGRVGVALDFRSPHNMVVSIVDSGDGISEDRQARIFEPFSRQERKSTDAQDGAGIGLALARAMARLHGGDITLRSEPGKGCRFDIIIPVGVEVADVDEELLTLDGERPQVTEEILFRTTAESAPASSRAATSTILIVDANDEFRRWASECLADVANVEGTPDCGSAIEIARDSVPDLVVVDDRPDASDGIALTSQLRADERTSHIPIILISSHAESDRRAKSFDAGADDYLQKPIDAEELRARTSGILARHQALRQQFREQVIIQPTEISENSVDQVFLEKVTSTVEASFEDPDFSVQDLGDAVAMSTSQLSRKLRALIDQSPAQLIRRMRLQRAADLIAANAGQISDVCYRVGFSDQSHFSRTFKRHFGMTPVDYRKEKAGGNGD